MSLLQVVQLPKNGVTGVPLFVEIPVHAETAPYLVTSYKGLLWVEQPLKGVMVRSAMVRAPWQSSLSKMLCDVTEAVVLRGVQFSWGNKFPSTLAGMKGAKACLKEYGFEDVEVLVRDYPSDWNPGMPAVVVPRDRSYLGMIGVWDADTYTVVVHNPARGMAVLGDW